MKDRPDINQYNGSKERISLANREEYQKSHTDREFQARRIANSGNKDSHQCTFTPSIRHSELNRTIDDLMSWKLDRDTKLAMKRLNNGRDCNTFRPLINSKSVKIIGHRGNNTFNRLFEQSATREEKLKKTQADISSSFNPQMNDHSRWLLNEREERLRKAIEFKGDKVEYYNASSVSEKKRNKLVKQSSTAKKLSDNHTNRCKQIDTQCNNRLKIIKKDPK